MRKKNVIQSVALGFAHPTPPLSGSTALVKQDNYFVSQFHHPRSGDNNSTSIIELLQRFAKEALVVKLSALCLTHADIE